MPISLDAVYAPELVEFWCRKYKESKEELERMKNLNVQMDRTRSEEESTRLKDLITALQTETAKHKDADTELRRMLKRAMDDEADIRKKLEVAESEKLEISKRLTGVEQERSSLSKQVLHFYSQAAALAAEAHRNRNGVISKMFPPVSFIEPSAEIASLHFTGPQDVIRTIPAQVIRDTSIYFLPRPPICMPLRVPSCGQAGYWFFPMWIPSQNTEFELVVEGRPGEWSYLGRYVSAHLEGHPMQLSEWLCLDEQTKNAHCIRVASQSLPPGQIASYSAQFEVKRKYETGEWSVPCYSLKCVGFNMSLYNALCAGSATSAATNPAPASQTPDDSRNRRRKSNADVTQNKKKMRLSLDASQESQLGKQKDQDTNASTQ